MKRQFYYQDDKSNKFWTIEVLGKTYVTTHGRIGSKGRETRKEVESEDEARRESEKQIALKLKKGYSEGVAPEYEKPDWAAMDMSEDVFWRILDLLNWKKLGNDEAVIKPAIVALSSMSVADIERFEDILSAKLYALDTISHAREIGEEAYKSGKYFSADWFLYSRCVGITNGREFYESVLADPERMPKDCEFEALLTIGPEAYQHKTGEEFVHVSPVSYESFSNHAGWLESEDT